MFGHRRYRRMRDYYKIAGILFSPNARKHRKRWYWKSMRNQKRMDIKDIEKGVESDD